MFGSHTLNRLISCTVLSLIFLFSSGENQPQEAGGGAPHVDGRDGQRVLILEAVKTGILSSLGMEREPRPAHKASEKELRRMYRLYRETLREMRGNSSNTMRETMSIVLFPAIVKTIKAPRQTDQQHMQWYRAVFRRNHNIQAEVTLVRAQLKISRRILDKPISVQPETRPEIEVKVNRKRPTNSPDLVNVSNTQDVILDIKPEVERWMRTDRGHRLVIDVGVVAEEDTLGINPTISLELDLKQAQRRRLPRSTKEDECDERGWCCRKSVTVSFKDIGWTDWVVAPTEYVMHFCDGLCPHNYKPASMHTQVKSRLHQITKGGTPRPCCVPTSYEPMVLMHYDSGGKLKLTSFNDLIVSKCQCA
ncbi:protein DVR-1 [Cheilinus undulatus]|uniref:protein DVR-1 n=1 Tax=Cheilinus undulatus TaxID=241271 RepID=UPI001BD4EDF1|nr:protein DVR-1 [Cheilinus undulatus]